MIIPTHDLLAVGLLLTVWLAVEMWEARRCYPQISDHPAPAGADFRNLSDQEDLDAILHICVVCEHAQEDHYKKVGRCSRADVGCHCERFRGR